MNKREKRSGFSFPVVGGTSLLVMFAVLCLITFAVLSLSTVKAGDRLGTLTLTDDFGNVKEIALVAATDAKTDSTLLYAGIGTAVVVAAAVVVLAAKKKKVA